MTRHRIMIRKWKYDEVGANTKKKQLRGILTRFQHHLSTWRNLGIVITKSRNIFLTFIDGK